MKSRLKKVLRSFKTTYILLIVVMLFIAGATVVEKYYGTSVARGWFYHSPLLFVPIVLLCINFLTLYFNKLKRRGFRISFIFTHFSFIFIVAGALVTHFHGFEGTIHIREGEQTNAIEVHQNQSVEFVTLPFSIELNDFVIERYPGSESPSWFSSFVTVHNFDEIKNYEVYMNNVLQIGGYRFYQMSFDKDEKGTILSVNYDPYGRYITYLGYIMLALGLLLTLFNGRGRIAQLWRGVISVAIFMIITLPVKGEDVAIPNSNKQEKEYYLCIDKEHAARFGELAVLQQGRVMPMMVFANQIVAKLSEDKEILGLNGVQFTLSVWAMAEIWKDIKFISVGNNALAEEFNLSNNQCSYNEAFDSNGNYKLASVLKQIYEKDAPHRNARDKAILALDERFNIFSQLMNGELFMLFPVEGDSANRWVAPLSNMAQFKGKDSLLIDNINANYIKEIRSSVKSGNWEECDKIVNMIDSYQKSKAGAEIYSEKRIKAELIYSQIEPFRWCKIGYLILGLLALIVAFRTNRSIKVMQKVLIILVTAVSVFHICGYALRCYIAGYVAMSNSYETMILLSFIIAILALLLSRRNFLAFALGLLFAGVILFVSDLSWRNPQITPLVPVLKSTWLMFHVAFIMAGYALFGFSAVLGVANLVQIAIMKHGYILRKVEKQANSIKSSVSSLTRINELSMWIGVVMTTIGIFMGAVWADNSWGRYWGWDPKESWALITMLAYVGITHLYLLRLKRYELWLNLLSVLAIAIVVMTYFGVNILFVGMHSYG